MPGFFLKAFAILLSFLLLVFIETALTNFKLSHDSQVAKRTHQLFPFQFLTFMAQTQALKKR